MTDRYAENERRKAQLAADAKRSRAHSAKAKLLRAKERAAKQDKGLA